MLTDPTALRGQFEADGYLYLRGVLDPEQLAALRSEYFSMFDGSYFRPGSGPGEGIFSGCRPAGLPAHGVLGHPAHEFVRSSSFARLAAEPRLAAIASALLGGPVQTLPRLILRHFDRSSPLASRAHTDFRYLDAGSQRLVTTWVPLGACPRETGGLVYLEGSHRLTPSELQELRDCEERPCDRSDDQRPITHDLGWVARRLGRRWLWADYAPGDITVHSPHIVHASLDTTTDLMRLTADIRFLLEGETPDPRWLTAWSGDDGN